MLSGDFEINAGGYDGTVDASGTMHAVSATIDIGRHEIAVTGEDTVDNIFYLLRVEIWATGYSDSITLTGSCDDAEVSPIAVTIYAGNGNDSIDASGYHCGPVKILGGYGNDTIVGSPQNDWLEGEDGDDVISGGGGNDNLSGGTGDDTLNGDDGNDTCDGGDGNDHCNGGSGTDCLIGGDGDDVLDGVKDGDDVAPPDSDFVNAASSHQRVDIHGVPLPDPSPTGDGESDRIPNTASVDAFSLTPTFSTTDIAVPLPGGELTLEFRRTLTVQSEVLSGYAAVDYRFPSETMLGPGWSTNLASRVILSYASAPVPGHAPFTATVYDDAGGAASYYSGTGTSFVPDVRNNFSNASLRATLAGGWYNTDLVYRGRFGTEYHYHYIQTQDRNSPLGPGTVDRYYRLEKVVDRNGNEIRYEYNEPSAPTLVTRMYDPSVSGREINYSYASVAGRLRLASAEDPLGRVFNYMIDNTDGWLNSVVKPAPDPAEPSVRPHVDFEYEHPSPLPQPRVIVKTNGDAPWDSYTLIQWTLPRTIKDARETGDGDGLTTTFTYKATQQLFPTGIQNIDNQSVEMFELRPVLESVTTHDGATAASLDGTITFNQSDRTLGDAVTDVQDAAGNTWTYAFETGVAPAPNNLGFALVTTHVTRSVVVFPHGLPVSEAVGYWYSAGINGNLTDVTDVSGNHLHFDYANGTDTDDDGDVDQYDSLDTSDPYNGFSIFGSLFGTRYDVYGQPARSVLAFDSLKLTTQYRYDVNFNKLIKQIDANGKVTEYILDTMVGGGGHGNRVEVIEAETTPAEAHTFYDYNEQGFVTRMEDPDHRETFYIPNQFGNLKYTVVKGYKGLNEDLTPRPGASFFTTFIDDEGQDLFGTDAGNWLIAYRNADVMDHTHDDYDGLGNKTHYDYDDWDRVTKTTYPKVLKPSYDPLTDGEPTPTDYESYFATKVYDFNSNVIKEIDERDNVTLTTYNAFNQPIEVRRRMSSPSANDDAADIITNSDYTPVGLLWHSTDANRNVTTFEYDALLRKTMETAPAPFYYTTNYYYDGANPGSGAFTLGGFNPTRVVNRRNFATDYQYDDAYRLVATIRRDAAPPTSSDDVPRAGDPATYTQYDALHKPVEVTVKNKRDGAQMDRHTYTFYDDQERPTITLIDLDGDGPGAGVTVGEIVNDPNAFYTTKADHDDIITRTTYDLAGNPITVTDANGDVTTTVYDGAKRATRVNLPPLEVYVPGTGFVARSDLHTTTDYDANSRPVLVTDARGNQTETTYGARGRVIRTVMDLDGNAGFDTLPGIGADDIIKWTGYDEAGTVIYTIDPDGNRTDTHYDRTNRPDVVTGPLIADEENGLTLTHPVTHTTYDHNGNVTDVYDPRNIRTHTDYDQLNRVRFVTVNADASDGDHDYLVTEKQYNENGNVLYLILHNWQYVGTPDKLSQTTEYHYDSFDRQDVVKLPDEIGIHSISTEYDLAGDAITNTDFKGQHVDSDYDLAGRVTDQHFYTTDGTLEEWRHSTYDKNGNLTSRSDKNGITTYTHDAMNRVKTEFRNTTTSGISDSYTVTSGYDAAGNRNYLKYPTTNRELISEYDRVNRMTQLNDGALISGFTYDPAGNRTVYHAPTGIVTTYTFDALNHVQTITARTGDGAGDLIYDVLYAYDLAGNRRTAEIYTPTVGNEQAAWDYDGAYRLTHEELTSDTGNVDQTSDWTYDPAGNRLSQVKHFGSVTETTTYEYSRTNAITHAYIDGVGPHTQIDYGYDGNGNRITKHVNVFGGSARDTTYTYDVCNRLTSVINETAGETIFTAAYDARTRRIAKTEGGDLLSSSATKTLFRYDGGTNFQELMNDAGSGKPLITELIRAGGLGGGIGSILYTDHTMWPDQGQWASFVYDAVGNTVELVDSSGTVVQENAYDAMGRLLYPSGGDALDLNNRMRNTKERDFSIGLDNDGFRYYDPDTGTYIQRDPTGYADGPNMYMSVHDNPINNVDPLGLSSKDDDVDATKAAVKKDAESRSKAIPILSDIGRGLGSLLTRATDATDTVEHSDKAETTAQSFVGGQVKDQLKKAATQPVNPEGTDLAGAVDNASKHQLGASFIDSAKNLAGQISDFAQGFGWTARPGRSALATSAAKGEDQVNPHKPMIGLSLGGFQPDTIYGGLDLSPNYSALLKPGDLMSGKAPIVNDASAVFSMGNFGHTAAATLSAGVKFGENYQVRYGGKIGIEWMGQRSSGSSGSRFSLGVEAFTANEPQEQVGRVEFTFEQ